jgi:Spy/CpxP family protein refolding chaperone
MRIPMTALAILLIAGTAIAQPFCGHCNGPCRLDGAGHGHGGGFFAGPGPHAEQRGQFWEQERRPEKMVEAFRLYKLTEYLELDEDQTAKIYPRMAEMKTLREEHHQAMQEKLEELRELLAAEKPEVKKAAALAREIQDSKNQMHDKMKKLEDGLFDVLSPEQQAKFVLFQHKFREHLERAGRRFERMHDGQGMEGDAPPPPAKRRSRRN